MTDKAVIDVLNDKNTMVLIPEFGIEYTIAYRWLRQNAPKVISDMRVYSELVLSSLQTDISIVAVARDYSLPVQVQEVADGRLTAINRPEKDLDAEVQVTTPVKVSKFWIRDNPMRPGRPDTAGILEALGKETSPWRLDFIDKGEPKPEILKLIKG